jgi:hypothetical protein
MAKTSLNCYVLPAQPLPLLLPIECVAALVEDPEISAIEGAPANWMKGHVTWENQRVSVLSYSALHDGELDESDRLQPVLVVLNPIPDAARKAFSGILTFGSVSEIEVDDSIEGAEMPSEVDRRYVEATVAIGTQKYIIPKLAALGVAFSYF